MLSETIIIVLIGALSTFGALVIRYGLKSKCSDVDVLCGCIKIHRDIEAEVREEMAEMTIHPDSARNQANSSNNLNLQSV